MTPKNAFYAQSGGVSAVINASACGVLEAARQHPEKIAKVYAGRNGIIGALTEDLIDTSVEAETAIAALKHTPGAAFGSCARKTSIKRSYCARCSLLRSARHIASETDVQQAYAVGRAAVEFAITGRSAVMPAIRRLSDAPYRWDIVAAPLAEVANKEKLLPPSFIGADGFGITEAARRYLAPLIMGEAYPPFKDGLPDYVKLRNVAVPRKLTQEFAVRTRYKPLYIVPLDQGGLPTLAMSMGLLNAVVTGAARFVVSSTMAMRVGLTVGRS